MRSNRFTGITDVKVTTLNGTVLDTESTYITMPTYLTPQSLFIPDISYEGEHNSLFSAKGVDWALALSEDTPRNERKPRLPLYDVNDREVGVIEVNKSGMVYVTPLEQETAIEQPRNVYVFATLVSNPEIETVYLITFSRYGEGYVLNGSVVEFTATAPNPIPYLSVDIEGSQDLNGYDKPWVGGAGKNKYNMPAFFKNSQTTPRQYWGSEEPDFTTLVNSLSAGTYTIAWRFIIREVEDTFRYSTRPILRTANGDIVTADYVTDSEPYVDKEYTLNVTFTLTPEQVGTITHIYWYMGYVPTQKVSVLDMQIVEESEFSQFYPYENICPITSYDSVTITQKSKNLFNKDGTILYGYWGANSWNPIAEPSGSSWCGQIIPVEEGKTYTWSGNQTEGGVYNVWLSDASDITSKISNVSTSGIITKTITAPEGAKAIWLALKQNTQSSWSRLQFEEGDTATSYEPYAKTYTVELTNAGNVYKGTLDVTSGELVVTEEVISVTSTMSWTKSNTYVGSFYVHLREYTNYKWKPNARVICNVLPWVAIGATTYKAGYCSTDNSFSMWFPFFDANTTVEEFKAYLASLEEDGNGVQIAYIYNEPETITLTPVQISNLIGYNKITANSGDVTAIVMPDSL